MHRERYWIAAGSACLLAVLLATLAALDLWIVRSPAERAFVASNVGCLRCHADLVARMDDPSVHRPFLSQQCTSCHTPHGSEKTLYIKPGDFSSYAWLADVFRALSLQVVWQVMTGPGLFGERRALLASQEQSTTVGAPSTLVTPEDELCWTCHGDVGPRDRTYGHRPFAEGKCTACHDPHSSQTKMLLRADAAQLCTTCHAVGDQLIASDVHPPFAKLQCLSCHDAHGSEFKGMLRVSQRDLCRTCHATQAADASLPNQHKPFATGDCTGCHRPHSGAFAKLLQAEGSALCYRCHDKIRPAFASALHHPIGCGECHAPHAAPQRYLLAVPQRELCLGCHPNVRVAIEQKKFVHAPAAKSDCTVCHSPHGSAWPGMLADSQNVVCVGCHPNKAPKPPPGRSQPPTSSVAAAPAAVRRIGTALATPIGTASLRADRFGVSRVSGFVPPPDQVVEGGVRPAGTDPVTTAYQGPWPDTTGSTHPTGGSTGVECSACHEPHGSDFPGVLRTNVDQLCTDCHGPQIPEFGASAHKDIACTACHEVHQSPNPELLKANQPELCRGCHPSNDYAMHPADPTHWDYVANKPLTCTSTCHDPHGSTHYRMLRMDYGENGKGTDYICLVCHTEVGITY